MAPLKKERAIAAMEKAFRRTADILGLRPPRIPHTGAVMVMALTLHIKYPDGVGDSLNILLLPNLFPLAGLEAALLTWKWDSILGGGTLTSFADMSLLMGKKKLSPITGWDEASSQLEAWAVFCTVFLVDDGVHRITYKMFLLLEETSGVRPRLKA